uniref:Reverse transcriptase domain-containing protein n=1 Tax=Tanacetum cinerariifolium TaxID=118510 RepID=A0A6L2MAF4_TANCI|nr:reverse transcriptase domain-containing protein [Tanacetum cinerariifolium]
MQTRSSSRLVSNPSSNPTLSTNPDPKGHNRRHSKQRIEEFNLDDLSPPIVTMADQRTMAQLLQAPTEGYEDAIGVPAITADNFELKHGLLTLVQIKACPCHGFSELHQLDTFYNALNSKDQDSLNSAAGGNFLDKMPCECLAVIESKSKVRYSRNKPVVAKVSMNTSNSGTSPDVAELKDMVKALLLDKKSQNQSPATVKAVEESCFVNSNGASTLSSGTLPSNTIANPRSDLKAITTQSGVSYVGPQIPPLPSFLPKVVEDKPEATKETVNPTNNGGTEDVQPQVVQSESPILTSELVTSPISESVIAPIFKDMSFEISFADALILMPKFSSTLKALIRNKEKLSEMAQTLLNEHCSAVLPKKLPKKLGEPGKFLIPCDFLGMAECLALADLSASINLMPFFVWKRLSLPDLTPTCMTLELADRSISHWIGVVEDVYVKVGELTLRVGKEAITFNLDQTSRYSANYSDMTAKRIYVIDMACEEYSQEVLGFYDISTSGNPTPFYDPIVSTTSLTLTPFGNSDFLLEEVDAFLAIEDDPTSPKFYQPYLDPEGDILPFEAFLNDDPSLPPPNQGNYRLNPWVSPVHCVPKKGGFTVVENEDNELILTRLVTGWRICIDYHKLNEATRKDHFPLTFMDQMLERLAGNQYYCFLDGFSDWDMPFELMCDASDFAIGAVLGIVYTNHSGLKYMFAKKDSKARLLRWVLLLQEFTFKVIDTKGAENLSADHLSRLENPHQNVLDPKEINESFPLETLNLVPTCVGENRASWSDKLDDALWAFLTAYKTPIGSGDHRKVQINELNGLRDQAYKNSLIYKEKTKRLHDSKIKNRVFNIGNRVLLFNTRLKIFSGKLKSRWSGPFTISQVYPYGTAELSQPDGPNFKVNGHRLKHYFGEDVPKLVVPDLQTFLRDY